MAVPGTVSRGLEPACEVELGGTLLFLRGQIFPRKRLPALVGLTLFGSILGALLLLIVPTKAMPLVIAVAMIMVAGFSLTKNNVGVSLAGDEPSCTSELAGYVLTFVLGVYGGFFSGGPLLCFALSRS